MMAILLMTRVLVMIVHDVMMLMWQMLQSLQNSVADSATEEKLITQMAVHSYWYLRGLQQKGSR